MLSVGETETIPCIGLVLATLLLGHQMSKRPLRQLGNRPMGHELWGWLIHFITDGVGIWGYDSSLGCWSPPIRLLLHLSLGGILCSFFGFHAWILYAASCFYINHMLPNVSHPGGARPRKIQRIPQFPTLSTNLDETDAKTWRCVVAEESHEDTERKFKGVMGAELTGEPFGRQIWTTQMKAKSKSRSVNEKLVLVRSLSFFSPLCCHEIPDSCCLP